MVDNARSFLSLRVRVFLASKRHLKNCILNGPHPQMHPPPHNSAIGPCRNWVTNACLCMRGVCVCVCVRARACVSQHSDKS